MWRKGGFGVMESLDRLASVGSGLSFGSDVRGAVKMDWDTFIEPATKPFGLLDSVHQE